MLFDGKFKTLFRQQLKPIVEGLTAELSSYSGSWAKGLLDSVVVKIEMDGVEYTNTTDVINKYETAPIYALQSKIQDDCVIQAA